MTSKKPIAPGAPPMFDAHGTTAQLPSDSRSTTGHGGRYVKDSNTATETHLQELCIREDQTYSRKELVRRIPTCSGEFISLLTDFFGLLPLGLSEFIYRGRNVIEALENHALGNIVERQRRPPDRELLRMMKKWKGKPNGEKEK